MPSLEDLKQRIDILDVLTRIGARSKLPDRWDEETLVFCPFCSDAASRKPAGRANSLKGLYHCFACGFGGDIVTVAQKHLTEDRYRTPGDIWGGYTTPFQDAIEWLEKEFPDPEKADPWKT